MTEKKRKHFNLNKSSLIKIKVLDHNKGVKPVIIGYTHILDNTCLIFFSDRASEAGERLFLGFLSNQHK